MMKNVNNSNNTDIDDHSVNINNSNDFTRVLQEIKLKQLQQENKKTKKNTKSKITSKNDSNNSDHLDTKLTKGAQNNIMKNKRTLSKSKSKEKHVQKQNSEQNFKKVNLSDNPIFPNITSLILDHEKENHNSESSHNVKKTADGKIKRQNTSSQIEKHTIYDIYAKTLKKLSIEDESDILKENEEGNLHMNENQIQEKKKNNVILDNSEFSGNMSDISSYNFIPTYETNNSHMGGKVNQQKEKDTKLKDAKPKDAKPKGTKLKEEKQKKKNVEKRYNYDKRNSSDSEQLCSTNNRMHDRSFYYSDIMFENSHGINEHHSNRNSNSYKEQTLKRKGKGKKGKGRRRESDRYKHEKESHEDIYKNQNKSKIKNMSEHSYMDGEMIYESSQNMEQKDKGKMKKDESLTGEDLSLKGNTNSKKEQNICFPNLYREAEKENNYFNNSGSFSMECLRQNDKQGIKRSEFKSDDMMRNTKHSDKMMNIHKEDTHERKKSVQESLKNIPEINMYHSLNDHIRKKKKNVYSKENTNYAKSDITTTDSEYYINENFNMSYDKFKSKNKKNSSLAEDSTDKEKLLKVVNSKNILNIRKILRVMREFYIGFIGLQLIYFITYLLFGNNSVYLIQIISISCTFFSLLDANYHGYLLNGFIDMCIGIFLNIAILQNIAGFKSLQSNDVLKNITISNVVFLYFFSLFSFLNSYFIHKLHSLERKNIKYVIQNIESKAENDGKSRLLIT
ncbi:conserved Plasmodium protein, unknown function [Plasmodium ovale wallikeri]|uniref:Basal complex transmembrane protein 1 n=1 Tax=Plasmodium ovale wallikeri TaxID=864142 RepID=A0A1A8Z4L6_PLAOA|nr:conserved Plasmodium protein, unknown function [Plasmodium ovale wallikeri]SBT39370.1 conserved Plasmodium protein, unknown function [Plasmodium ovale wallikeri]